MGKEIVTPEYVTCTAGSVRRVPWRPRGVRCAPSAAEISVHLPTPQNYRGQNPFVGLLAVTSYPIS